MIKYNTFFFFPILLYFSKITCLHGQKKPKKNIFAEKGDFSNKKRDLKETKKWFRSLKRPRPPKRDPIGSSGVRSIQNAGI